ncbi:hypothetical protein X777_11607, partial [Ooceraea biroi]
VPSHLPKHLLWLVARSMKTLEEITLPNGRNICMSSPSPNSWGRCLIRPRWKFPREETKREDSISGDYDRSPQCTYHRLVAKQQPTSVDSATPRTATDIECETPN